MANQRLTTMLGVEGGNIQGHDHAEDGVLSFKGIPYCAPPTGNNRWREPQPIVPWEGVKDCSKFGLPFIACDPFTNNPKMDGFSEESLLVNVWAPAKQADEKLPVMVWIHLGAFQYCDAHVNGVPLAKKGVVVVSFSYRLEIFGFLAHPLLTAESPHHTSGCYGMLDMIEALKWVQRNIGRFGGDPGNVTVFGESAGAHAIALLQVSPLAKGLFHRAIGESGGFWESENGPTRTREQMEKLGIETMEKLGVKTLEEMRALPADVLQKASNWIFPCDPGLYMFSAVVDGYVVPEQGYDCFEKGEQIDVPLLVGWNEGESISFANRGLPCATKEEFADALKKKFGEFGEEALKWYPANTDEEAKHSSAELSGDLVIAYLTWGWAHVASKTSKNPVYVYNFQQHSDYNPAGIHAAEITYVFNELHARTPEEPNYFIVFGLPPKTDTPTPADFDLADKMSSYWVNFAKTGNPNGPGLPEWPQYKPDGEPIMVFETPIRIGEDPNLERFKFVHRAFFGRRL